MSLPFGARAAPLIFCAVAHILCELAAFHLGVPIVSFVDDFFAVVPSEVAAALCAKWKWFVVDLLGFRFKEDKKEFNRRMTVEKKDAKLRLKEQKHSA